MAAAKGGQIAVLKWLVLEAKADVNAQANNGMSSVMITTVKGDVPTLKWLVLEGGGDVHSRAMDGVTVVMAAALSNQVAALKWLVEEGGADVHACAHNGKTILDCARTDEVRAIVVNFLVNPLIEYMVDLPKPTSQKQQPLEVDSPEEWTDEEKLRRAISMSLKE